MLPRFLATGFFLLLQLLPLPLCFFPPPLFLSFELPALSLLLLPFFLLFPQQPLFLRCYLLVLPPFFLVEILPLRFPPLLPLFLVLVELVLLFDEFLVERDDGVIHLLFILHAERMILPDDSLVITPRLLEVSPVEAISRKADEGVHARHPLLGHRRDCAGSPRPFFFFAEDEQPEHLYALLPFLECELLPFQPHLFRFFLFPFALLFRQLPAEDGDLRILDQPDAELHPVLFSFLPDALLLPHPFLLKPP